MNVAVIGASDNPEKYSYMAVDLLRQKGHKVFPVHPKIKEIQGIPVYASIKDIPEPVHTVSLYISEQVSSGMADELVSVKPKRMIFNPGAENPALNAKASKAGIETINACTLVMLKTNQF
jgi:predicted CoA-binding protein